MNEMTFRPYGHLVVFAIAGVVTFFMVPELAYPIVPDVAPWLVVIGAAALAVVAASRVAISGRGKLKAFGIVAALASIGWLVFLAMAINHI